MIMVELMKKPQPKLKSIREFVREEEHRRAHDPGRDDEGYRRYMVSTGDEAALITDDEMRTKVLVDRLERAYLGSDKVKVHSCSRAIALIGKKYRNRMMTAEVFAFQGWRDAEFVKEIMLRSTAIGKGDSQKRKAAMVVLSDFCKEYSHLHGRGL